MTSRKTGWKALKSFLAAPPLLLQCLLIVVLFLRTIWGMWNVRDLTTGDTSYYFSMALRFAKNLTCNIAWSPLYTSFFGAFYWINHSPYFIDLAHRIVIIAILVWLIFEVSRRLLSSLIGWLVCVWWLALPINFDALYEVHLFAFIPILLFWLLISRPTLRKRGICVGLLLAITFLVRNEILVVLVVFGTVSMALDGYLIWKGKAEFKFGSYLAAYGIPIIFACLIIVSFYFRSTVKYPLLSELLKYKHTLNVSQIYSFGYGQRHPGYKDSPWTNYQPLMLRDFGNDLPTMREAIKANPRAMMEHFLWDARLIPNGLQVALFNCRMGGENPDYANTIVNKPVSLALSLLYLVTVFVGMGLLLKDFRFWWNHWLLKRAWLLFAIATVCLTVCIVMVMQRPRPSYMFALSLSLMWLAGFSVQVILHYLPKIRLVLKKTAILPMVAIVFIIPRIYVEAKVSQKPSSRALLTNYRMLQPYQENIQQKQGKAATAGYTVELNSYLGCGDKPPEERMIDTKPLLARLKAEDSLNAALRKSDVHYLVISPAQENDRKVREFVAQTEANGWAKIRTYKTTRGKFWLYISISSDKTMVQPSRTP